MNQADKLLDQIYRVKIRPMSAQERREIADYLGVTYFTIMGKLSKTVLGNFTPRQRQKLKEWFGGKDGRGNERVSQGTGVPQGDDSQDSEVLPGERN